MRGNPVMRAKRVTGPTPNTVLCLKFNAERCSCGGPATRSHTIDGVITRMCVPCIAGEGIRPVASVRPEITSEMWWLAR